MWTQPCVKGAKKQLAKAKENNATEEEIADKKRNVTMAQQATEF